MRNLDLSMRRRALLLVGLALAAYAGAASGAIPVGNAAFPGRNGLIAFSRDGQIFTARADGSEESQITEGGVNKSPSWSSDGSRLAWSCDDDICVSDATGSDVEKLSGPPYDEQQPSWSPDGRWIVFTRP